MNTLFPIFLKLEQIHTLVVGAGNIGLEKLKALLQNAPAAHITVVALTFSEEFKAFISAYPQVICLEKAFSEEDLSNKQLLISASNNPTLDQQLRSLSQEKGLLFNAADKPALCDFYLSSIVQQGNLKLAISTNGKSPTIAKRLKEFLNELLPDEIDETLELMHLYRQQLKGNFQEKIKVLNAHTQSLVYDRAN